VGSVVAASAEEAVAVAVAVFRAAAVGSGAEAAPAHGDIAIVGVRRA
jgi:hypothetical protein